MWQNTPPTYEQWTRSRNEGYWWIKTIIPSEDDFPEFALYEAVRLYFEVSPGENLFSQKGRLFFDYRGAHIYCDSLPDFLKEVQWEPVQPHSDNGV